jgi:hypothetical protein
MYPERKIGSFEKRKTEVYLQIASDIYTGIW